MSVELEFQCQNYDRQITEFSSWITVSSATARTIHVSKIIHEHSMGELFCRFYINENLNVARQRGK